MVRLTDEPGSASLYFNQNGYTADGKKLVFTTAQGISVLDLETHTARPVVQGQVRIIVAGRKTQNVYYIQHGGGAGVRDERRYVSHAQIAALPARGSVSTVNADETLLAGTYTEVESGAEYRAPRCGPGAGADSRSAFE